MNRTGTARKADLTTEDQVSKNVQPATKTDASRSRVDRIFLITITPFLDRV